MAALSARGNRDVTTLRSGVETFRGIMGASRPINHGVTARIRAMWQRLERKKDWSCDGLRGSWPQGELLKSDCPQTERRQLRRLHRGPRVRIRLARRGPSEAPSSHVMPRLIS